MSLTACRVGSKLPGTTKRPLDFGIRVRIWKITTCKTDGIVVNLPANVTMSPSTSSSATQPSKVSPPYLGRQLSQTYVKGGGRDSNSVVLHHQGTLAVAYDAQNCAQLVTV